MKKNSHDPDWTYLLCYLRKQLSFLFCIFLHIWLVLGIIIQFSLSPIPSISKNHPKKLKDSCSDHLIILHLNNDDNKTRQAHWSRQTAEKIQTKTWQRENQSVTNQDAEQESMFGRTKPGGSSGPETFTSDHFRSRPGQLTGPLAYDIRNRPELKWELVGSSWGQLCFWRNLTWR